MADADVLAAPLLAQPVMSVSIMTSTRVHAIVLFMFFLPVFIQTGYAVLDKVITCTRQPAEDGFHPPHRVKILPE